MNRRGFLGTLAASIAAAKFALGASAPTNEPQRAENEGSSPDLMLHAREVLMVVASEFSRPLIPVSGHMGTNGLAHQIRVEAAWPLQASHIAPSGTKLASKLRLLNPTVCGQLSTDLPGAESVRVTHRSGLSLRAIKQYRIHYDDYVVMYDVLVG